MLYSGEKKVFGGAITIKNKFKKIKNNNCISEKNLQIINAGDDVEKRELSYTVGRNVNW